MEFTRIFIGMNNEQAFSIPLRSFPSLSLLLLCSLLLPYFLPPSPRWTRTVCTWVSDGLFAHNPFALFLLFLPFCLPLSFLAFTIFLPLLPSSFFLCFLLSSSAAFFFLPLLPPFLLTRHFFPKCDSLFSNVASTLPRSHD